MATATVLQSEAAFDKNKNYVYHLAVGLLLQHTTSQPGEVKGMRFYYTLLTLTNEKLLLLHFYNAISIQKTMLGWGY